MAGEAEAINKPDFWLGTTSGLPAMREWLWIATLLVRDLQATFNLSYDRRAGLLAPYGNHDALQVAQNLDKKIEDLLRQAAA